MVKVNRNCICAGVGGFNTTAFPTQRIVDGPSPWKHLGSKPLGAALVGLVAFVACSEYSNNVYVVLAPEHN